MTFVNRIAGAVALAGVLIVAGIPQAGAALFNWSFSGDTAGDTGSGTLTTTGSTSPFTVTDITGTFDGNTITALLPAGSFALNDNLVFEPAPFLDGFGISFSIAGGTPVNIFFDPNFEFYVGLAG